MIFIEIVIILFLFTIFAAACAPRFNLPVEVFLLLASLTISLVPGLPPVSLSSEVVFTLFLPPILFSAAFFTSWHDFKVNLQPILLMAIGLVLFSTCGVALLIKWLIPQMSWPLSFLLGAIVSPPDASAATALVKKMGMPRRLVTLLEGESLINDATAIIAFKFALAAVLTGTFSLQEASFSFVGMSLGGIILGYILNSVTAAIYRKLKDNKSKNMLSLALPYLSYFIAEHLGLSGIIATVSTGLFFARTLPEFSDAETRHKGEVIWEILIFVINGLVFTLMGLQLQSILKGLGEFSLSNLMLYAAVCSLLVVLARFFWIFSVAYLSRWFTKTLGLQDPTPPWSQLALLSWVGMRGIVSLAAALSLPEILPNGDPFPLRSLLIFLTYCVILTTLLVPTLSLGKLIKIFKISDDGEYNREIVSARLILAQTVLNFLDDTSSQAIHSPNIIQQTRNIYERWMNSLHANLSELPHSEISDDIQTKRKLGRSIIKIERETILHLRKNGKIHDKVFYDLQRELDIEDLRLKNQRL